MEPMKRRGRPRRNLEGDPSATGEDIMDLNGEPLPEEPDMESQDAAAAPAAATEAAPAAPQHQPRGDLRRPMRGSPRDANRRAAEILSHLGTSGDEKDDFHIPESAKPDGWSYEWKRKTVLNQEDPTYEIQLRQTGWEPVPASRHPDMMPLGSKSETIERRGMVLMERPAEITNHFKALDNKRARDLVRSQQQQLGNAPQGQFDRNHPQVKPKISKGYEAMPIPKD